MDIKLTSEGKANLHIWRTGQSYEKQKGAVYRREWNNILFTVVPSPPNSSGVIPYDIRQPLPYPDNTFDAVFAVRIVEHLSLKEGGKFIKEIFRILKPEGVCRVSTPDLEDICRNYLLRLEQGWADASPSNVVKYDWAVLELLDQVVRDKSGGLMSEAIKNKYYDLDYGRERYRDVFEEFYAPPTNSKAEVQSTALPVKQLLVKMVGRIKRLLSFKDVQPPPSVVSQNPRMSREAHLWLYDRLSLSRLLSQQGFVEVAVRDYKSSAIPNWEKYNFNQSEFGDYDIEPSLYVEGKKLLNL